MRRVTPFYVFVHPQCLEFTHPKMTSVSLENEGEPCFSAKETGKGDNIDTPGLHYVM